MAVPQQDPQLEETGILLHFLHQRQATSMPWCKLLSQLSLNRQPCFRTSPQP
jgi:hypothetical protein